MNLIQDVAACALIVAGLVFVMVAAVGFTRLPDVFSRLHVTGILDTLGAPLVLLGVALWSLPSLVSGKLTLALVFLLMTSPLIGHLLSRSALETLRRDPGPKVPTRTSADPEERTPSGARS